MFEIAILIGVYSYIIFALGLLGLLYGNNILILTFIFFIFCAFWFRKNIKYAGRSLARSILAKAVQGVSLHKLSFLLIFLLLPQVVVNLVGALGPELGFDALWYHLTLPKLYLLNHSLVYVPGGLFYYSAMPKLTEMLYTASLVFGNEILAKFIHFSFGILSCIVIYFLSRKFFNRKISLIAVVIFYSNLVVGWQSITAYIDLVRTFFEIMALWGFLNFLDKDTPCQPRARSILEEKKWLIESAVMTGLAIATKLLSLGSLIIFTVLLTFKYVYGKNKDTKELIANILVYWTTALIISLPWFVFSFIHTGNPIYPFFTNTYPVALSPSLLNPINFIKDMWTLFTNLPDRISLLYIIFLPFVFLHFKKFYPLLRLITIFSLLALIIWYFTPRTGGGRFILPYLPAFSIVTAGALNEFKKSKYLYRPLIGVVILLMLFSIVYRGVANTKYLPVILGKESKTKFLEDHLNFSFGDFYDIDGYFKSHIKPNDRVLLYGFHNLYYVDFPFVDSSWVKKGDTFNYIATQNTQLPKRFSYWNVIYRNPKTYVSLYSLRGQKWVY